MNPSATMVCGWSRHRVLMDRHGLRRKHAVMDVRGITFERGRSP
jgi:hypothetical protein